MCLKTQNEGCRDMDPESIATEENASGSSRTQMSGRREGGSGPGRGHSPSPTPHIPQTSGSRERDLFLFEVSRGDKGGSRHRLQWGKIRKGTVDRSKESFSGRVLSSRVPETPWGGLCRLFTDPSSLSSKLDTRSFSSVEAHGPFRPSVRQDILPLQSSSRT